MPQMNESSVAATADASTPCADAALFAAAQAGDIAARNHLVVQHLGLVHSIAKRLTSQRGRHEAYDDAVQVGVCGRQLEGAPGGLMRAIATYDVTRGTAFATYAYAYIKYEIELLLGSDSLLTAQVSAHQRQARRVAAVLAAELGHDPSPEEVHASLTLSSPDANGRRRKRYSAKFIERARNGSGLRVAYDAPDVELETADDDAATRIEAQVEATRIMAVATDALPQHKVDMLSALAQGAYIQETAKALGENRETTRRRTERAISRVRKILKIEVAA